MPTFYTSQIADIIGVIYHAQSSFVWKFVNVLCEVALSLGHSRFLETFVIEIQ
jgi:hypothetical protein